MTAHGAMTAVVPASTPVAPARPHATSEFDEIPVATLVAGPDGRIAAVNRAWCELTGMTRARSVPDGWLEVIDPSVRMRLVESIARTAATGGSERLDLELALATGPRWTRWHVSGRDAGSGSVVAVVDLSDEIARQRELEERAAVDPLTGLVNRSEFLDFAGHALRRLERHPGRVAVLFVDLDRFKDVNDSSGHLTGDLVLAAAAGRLRDAVRPEDVVARIGGDEFAVLCEDLRHDRVERLARRVRAAFRAPLVVEEVQWRIGASVGVAESDRPDAAPTSLLAAADRAMYRSKPGGAQGATGSVSARDDLGWPGRPADPAHGAGLSLEIVHRLMGDVFAVGVDLTSCAVLSDEPMTGRLRVAVDELDRIVSGLREAVFEPEVVGERGPGGGRPSRADLDWLVGLVDRAAEYLNLIGADRSVPGSSTLDLLDAAYWARGATRAIERARPAIGDSRRARSAGDPWAEPEPGAA